MSTATSNSRVFLSYSRSDRTLAEAVAQSLRSAGYLVFSYLEESRIDDRNWMDVIAREVEEAETCIVLLSEHYLASSNCLAEMKFIRERSSQGDPVFAINPRKLPIPDDLGRCRDLIAIDDFMESNGQI
jgi:hypothetical protein